MPFVYNNRMYSAIVCRQYIWLMKVVLSFKLILDFVLQTLTIRLNTMCSFLLHDPNYLKKGRTVDIESSVQISVVLPKQNQLNHFIKVYQLIFAFAHCILVSCSLLIFLTVSKKYFNWFLTSVTKI